MLGGFLVVVVFPALLIVAAGWDVASYTIPNSLSLALVTGFAVFAVAKGLSPGEVGSHALAGSIGLAAGFALFAAGFIGGGDAKLFAAIILWFGFRDFLGYAVLAALTGGALTVVFVSLRSLPLPATLFGRAWVARIFDNKAGIPYGVALSGGALFALPHTAMFHMAVAGG